MKWCAIPCKVGTTPEQAKFEKYEQLGTDLVIFGEYKTLYSFIRYTFTRLGLESDSHITKELKKGRIWRIYTVGEKWHYRTIFFDVPSVTKMMQDMNRNNNEGQL